MSKLKFYFFVSNITSNNKKYYENIIYRCRYTRTAHFVFELFNMLQHSTLHMFTLKKNAKKCPYYFILFYDTKSLFDEYKNLRRFYGVLVFLHLKQIAAIVLVNVSWNVYQQNEL